MNESQLRARVLKTVNQPAQRLRLEVNGRVHSVVASADTPLLYVLRNELHLSGPRFGCGLAQCGACTVHRDGVPIRACVTPVAGVVGRKITTLEGLTAVWAEKQPGATMHPVQQAWIDEQVPQCGYCQNGMIIQATELLHENPKPTIDEIKTAMNGHLCRCSTYQDIIRAVQRAAKEMA
jgi:aerobic-type carbon monoxide dehydrogenase small subunit (CoxS/CutS family)